MRYKPLPAPRTREDMFEIRGAIPLVPGVEADCCSRIVTRTDVAGRDRARTWLTFLTALGLVHETDRGYHRSRNDPGPAELGDRFLDCVFGAREVYAIVQKDGPIGAEAIFEAFREHVPRWERNRRTDWEATWRERTSRLLAWGVRFDRFERTAGGAFDAVERE